jgi:hypothetical protein
MSDPATTKEARPLRAARLLWFLGFVMILSSVGWLMWSAGPHSPTLELPNGTQLKFETITQPATPPPGSHSSRHRHRAPSSGESWWTSAYRTSWQKLPAWVNRQLPTPSTPLRFDIDEMLGFRHGVSNYRIWLESSGPEYPWDEWTVTGVNVSLRGSSYGGIGGSLMISGKPVAKPLPTKWLQLYLDALPPPHTPQIVIKFSSKVDQTSLVLEIPNPNHQPGG